MRLGIIIIKIQLFLFVQKTGDDLVLKGRRPLTVADIKYSLHVLSPQYIFSGCLVCLLPENMMQLTFYFLLNTLLIITPQHLAHFLCYFGGGHVRVNFDFLFFINIKGEGNLTKWFVLNFEGRILLVCLLILDDEGFGNGFSGVPRLTFIHCLYLTVIYISIIAQYSLSKYQYLNLNSNRWGVRDQIRSQRRMICLKDNSSRSIIILRSKIIKKPSLKQMKRRSRKKLRPSKKFQIKIIKPQANQNYEKSDHDNDPSYNSSLDNKVAVSQHHKENEPQEHQGSKNQAHKQQEKVQQKKQETNKKQDNFMHKLEKKRPSKLQIQNKLKSSTHSECKVDIDDSIEQIWNESIAEYGQNTIKSIQKINIQIEM